MRKIHGSFYPKEHAIITLSFLQVINLETLVNFLQIGWLLRLPIFYKFLFAMVLYFINRKVLYNKVLKGSPSRLMILVAIFYLLGSLGLLCLSYLYYINW